MSESRPDANNGPGSITAAQGSCWPLVRHRQPASGTLVGVFEHFTDGARRALIRASEEAQHLDGCIQPQHLLLGIVRGGESVAAEALSDLGADDDRIRGALEDCDVQQAGQTSGRKPFSGSSLRILERSVELSWDLAEARTSTEHLLAALLREQDETIEAVLAALDITPQEVVLRVNALLADPTSCR
jgi:ATP-dependent Clp protease ATP-binding subunit ClpC